MDNQQPIQPRNPYQPESTAQPQRAYQPQPQTQPMQPIQQPIIQPQMIPGQYQPNQPVKQTIAPQPSGKGLTIAGIIFGLLGISPIGLILSTAGRSKAKKANTKTGLATFGVWLNVLVLIASLALVGIYGYSFLKLYESTVQAKNNAEIVQIYAEKYDENRSEFPDELSDFDEGTINDEPLANLVKIVDEIDQNNGSDSVIYQYIGEKGDATGGRIMYYDFSSNAVSDNVIYIGDADENSTFIDIL